MLRLDTHSRFSIHNILGSARNWAKEAKDLLAKVFVSEVETEVRQKIKEKHIKRVSIGYQTDPDYTVEIPKDRSIKIDGVEYKNEFQLQPRKISNSSCVFISSILVFKFFIISLFGLNVRVIR